MERKNYSYLIILLLFLYLNPAAASEPMVFRKQIYQAFISNQMTSWENHMNDYARKLSVKASIDQRLELASAYYGYIGYCLSQKLTTKAELYVEKADENLDLLLAAHPNSAEAHAFKAANYGFRIGLSNFKAVYLGRKSQSHLDKALKINPQSFQACYEDANATYYKPAIVGGSKTKALGLYQKAVTILEKNPTFLSENWLYLLALTNLGRALEESGDLRKARSVYEKILQAEPGYVWVKTKLLPNLLTKMK